MRKKREELTLFDRQTIHVMKSRGSGIREICRVVNRSTSVVSGEFHKRHPSRETWRRMSALERAKWSHDEAKRRRKRSGTRLRLKSPELRSHVIERLQEYHWSPEEIAKTVWKYLPGVTVSARAIYYFIKHERPDLAVHLPERGKARRRRAGTRQRKSERTLYPKRSIEERPEVVSLREEFGHWEGDTIHSKRGTKGGVLSLVERRSRFGIYRLVPDLQAHTILGALRACFCDIPPSLRKSLTLDNGSEFALSELQKFEEDFSIPIYYCHPYSAHERGTVERRNKNVRYYYPKGTDFSTCQQYELQRAIEIFHNRPMKVLDYRSSAEVWNEILQETLQKEKAAA